MKSAVLLAFALSLGSAILTPTAIASPSAQHAQRLSSSAFAIVPTPEVKGRKGSKRVGARNSRGKKSRYVGGRK